MRRAIILSIAAFLAIGTAFAQEVPQQPRAPQQTQQEQDVKYTNDSIARVSFIDGKTFLQRASELGNEEAVLNMPVGEGDRLTTAEGRAEIHFGKANYLRLDNDSKVDILNLPKKNDEIARIRVWSGSVYLVVGTLAKEKSIEIHTADSSFYVLDKGVYRIDVRENQDTQIFVHSGLIEAAGEGGSSLVKDGQSLEITEGRFASKPATFVADTNDAFDKFSQSRDASLGRTFAKKYLPEELGDYESDLNDNGRWVYQAPYGNVWVPNGVDEEWRPYWDGRWVWLGLSGWTWLPYEPWGWATFHYGRWHWGMGLGWYWIPTTMWGPGWVDWWWDDYYFGWAPLSFWGYPGVLWGGAYYGGYYGHDYPVGSRALTVIRRDQLKAPNASRVALRGDALKGISRVSLTNRTLSLRPAGTKISVQPLSGNRVILRNSEGSGSLVPGRNIDRNSLGRPSSGSTTSSPSVKRSGGNAGAQTKGTQTQGKPSTVTKSGNSGSSGKSGSARSSGSSKSSGSSGRTIRKHDPSASASMNSSQSYFPSQGATGQVAAPRSVQTYPSSPSVTRTRIYGDGGAARTGSYTNRFTGRPSGSTYSRPSTSSRSGSSSSGRSSSGSSVRSGSSRSSSSSARSSSGSRSSSGASRSSSGSRSSSSGSRSSGGHRR